MEGEGYSDDSRRREHRPCAKSHADRYGTRRAELYRSADGHVSRDLVGTCPTLDVHDTIHQPSTNAACVIVALRASVHTAPVHCAIPAARRSAFLIADPRVPDSPPCLAWRRGGTMSF